MIIQAHEYEGAQEGMTLQEFFDSTAGRFKTETGYVLAAHLVDVRVPDKVLLARTNWHNFGSVLAGRHGQLSSSREGTAGRKQGRIAQQPSVHALMMVQLHRLLRFITC